MGVVSSCGVLNSDANQFVATALDMFRSVREDPSGSLEPSLIPTCDYYALDSLSELVALLPEENLRGLLLSILSNAMNGIYEANAKKNSSSSSSNGKGDSMRQRHDLPELLEDELVETFARGSGPGGQKINKTSNKVILVHEPTHIRVECQETRSLQQNRKIARKRLRLKLDEYLHGSASRTSVKAQKASSKKAKAKARSRARLRQKKQQKVQKQKQA